MSLYKKEKEVREKCGVHVPMNSSEGSIYFWSFTFSVAFLLTFEVSKRETVMNGWELLWHSSRSPDGQTSAGR